MMKQFNVKITNRFKKQYSKIKKYKNFKKSEFEKVVEILANNEILPTKYKKHLLNPKDKRYLGMSYWTRHIIRI